MVLRVYCIVEGHGDVDAFPILIRRMCAELFGEAVVVEVPYRLPKGRITRPVDLQGVLELGALRLKERAEEGDKLLMIVSRDADDECPVAVAKTINDIAAQTMAKDICHSVIPNEEFEAWLLAGAAPLAQHPDCVGQAYVTDNADSIKNPKGVFERQVLREERTYSETVDQPKFTAQIELGDATFGRSRSLRRLRDVIERTILA